MNGIRRTSLRASHTAMKRRLRTFLFAVLVSALAGGGLQPAWAQSGTVLAFPGGPFGIGNNGFVALPFIERPDAHFTVTAWVQPEDLSQDFHFDPGTATVYTHAARIPRLSALNPAHQLRRQAPKPVRPLTDVDGTG